MSFSCSCSQSFARQGDLTQHLLKSSGVKCRPSQEKAAAAIRRPVRHNRPRTQSQNHPQLQSSPDIEEEQPPLQFQGDYFGEDYVDEDFPYAAPNSKPADQDDPPALNLQSVVPTVTEVDEGELSDDEDDAVGRDVIEPDSYTLQPDGGDHPHLSASEAALDVVQAALDDNHDAQPEELPQDDHHRLVPDLHSALREPPAYVQRFGGLAGQPTTNPNVRISSYHSYGARITGSAENLFAPFKSRMEWDLAQWAKRRGSGSTAFTELLEIEGVRLPYYQAS